MKRIIKCLAAWVLAATASAAPTVYDDAVFWFRGGKDCVTANGNLETGEFFDDLHADDEGHAHHQLPPVAGCENAVFRTERVVFPSLGREVGHDMKVLYISDKDRNSARPPFAINAKNLYIANNISNHYTFVARLRLDKLTSTDWIATIGYDGGNKRGLLLGFGQHNSNYPDCKRVSIYWTPNQTEGNRGWDFSSLYVKTNTWFDLSVTVGNGKLRLGIATQGGDAGPTLAFEEKEMLTDNCTLIKGYDGPYRFFAESVTSSTTGNFEGSVQQIALWNRTFTDREVMEAFGMPRPSVFRVGFDNGSSAEFGGDRESSEQTIDGLGSWRDVTGVMAAGDTWTVRFPVLKSESDSRGPFVPYVFSLRSLPDSAISSIRISLNGVSLGTRRVGKNARAFWPVASGLFAEGVNSLTIERTDGGSGNLKLDAMELGGALSVGYQNGSGSEMGSAVKGKIATAANPNPLYWWNTLQAYDNKNNMTFWVWANPELKDYCPATLELRSMCLNRHDASGKVIKGGEFFKLFVNGIHKATRNETTAYEKTVVNFEPGELNAGWNEINLKSDIYDCYWQIDYYRFWLTLDKGFAVPEVPGMMLMLK